MVTNAEPVHVLPAAGNEMKTTARWRSYCLMGLAGTKLGDWVLEIVGSGWPCRMNSLTLRACRLRKHCPNAVSPPPFRNFF
jgi:hypothetical protein